MKRHSCFSFLFAAALVFCMVGMDWTSVGDEFRYGKLRYTILLAAGLACWRLRRANPFLAAFSFLSAFAWVWFDFNSYGTLEGFLPLAVFFIAVRVTDDFTVEGFAKLVAWCAFAQACYGFLQLAHVEPYLHLSALPDGTSFAGKMIGTLGHYTMLSPFVGLGVCFFLSRKQWLPAAVCALAVGLADSSMGILSTAAGVGYLAFRIWPRRTLAAGVLAVAGMALAKVLLPDAGFLDLNGRAFLWPYGWRAFTMAPYFGHGPGSWLGLYPVWNVPGGLVWAQLHCEPLQLAVEMGLVGIAFVAAMVLNAFCKVAAAAPFLGAWLVLLCVNSLANFPLHMAPFGLVAAWLLVVLESGDVAPVKLAR